MVGRLLEGIGMPSSGGGPTMLYRSPVQNALPVGHILGEDYEIRGVLGSSAFGVTYKAHDRTVDISVAIKEYLPLHFSSRRADAEVVPVARTKETFEWGKERFLQESQALARFKHDNIVRLFRAFKAHGTAYSVLELVEGKPLGIWLKDLDRRPTQPEMDVIFEPLTDALAYIHGRNMLHRDLSPDTILIRGAGAGLTPIMLDFGAAKEFYRQQQGMSDAHSATYAAVEQFTTDGRQQGPWTDIYSLSGVMYEALTGTRPPQSTTRQLEDPIQRLSKVMDRAGFRPDFLEAVDQGFRLKPTERPQSVTEWRKALFSDEGARRLRRRSEVTKIFISYRREDSKHVAGRIFDRLAQEFGEGEIFFDVDTIPVGVDFRSHVASSIEDSAVVIALIGDKWTNREWRKRKGLLSRWRRARADFVEIELETAMQMGVPVIPVLIDATEMPGEPVLSAPIKPLAYLNATRVRSGRDFRGDIERVVELVRPLRG